MLVRERLARGEFNNMSQAVQADGSLLVTMTRRGDPHIYKLWVRDLYQVNEVIIREAIENNNT